MSTEGNVSVPNESAREGIDSIDTVRVESADPSVLSLIEMSSSRSSGALRSRSNGLLLRLRLSSFSDSCARSMMASTVILFSLTIRCRRVRWLFNGGMLVTASKAATDGGIASGECPSFARCEECCLRL